MANWQVLVAILSGTAIGLVVGALPGLGSVVAVTVVLPFTFPMEPVPAIALLLAVYCCSVFGGSFTAVLLNTPGTPQSAATVLDGYAMTRAGKGDLALGWVAGASVFGGLFSTVVMVLLAPQLAAVALRFGPVETFGLICLALTCISGVSGKNIILGWIGGFIGLMLGTVGVDPLSGQTRFTFDVFAVSSGIQIIPVLVGLFALSEVLYRLNESEASRTSANFVPGFRLPPLRDWLARWKTLLSGSVIGSAVGALPGTGAATAAFISYATTKRFGRFRKDIGEGEPEGIVASETANNAVTGGALVPTLALGIPGDPVTAVLMTALIIHGIQPGTRLFVDTPELVYAAFLVLIMANLVMFASAGVFSRIFSRIVSFPQPIQLTLITVLSVVGSYGVRGNLFDLWVMVVAGVVGYLCRIAAIAVAPIVIGMVLGPFLEQSLRQGLILTRGSFLEFFASPIAATLMAVSLLIVLTSLVLLILERRKR
ncbi:tripartite tricarboxylate transporter permease [Acuticoccus sp.]|uniref:tripartite tricarboxylate transporter permease n=1 Tax=Acuticoccus sp. TaxID=1904378 RepID=UPI003B5210E7